MPSAFAAITKAVNALCDLPYEQLERPAGTARAIQHSDMYGQNAKILRRVLSLSALMLFTAEAWSVDTPALVSPANNATGQPVSLTLTWNAVAFADSYRVQIARDSLYADLAMDRSVAGLAMSLQSLQAGPLGNDSLFFWRVRARDAGGSVGGWSSSWRFRTAADRPGIPLLLAPSNAATGILLTDSLKWRADPVADAYRVQVSSSLSFPPAGTPIDTLVGVSWGNQIQGLRLSRLLNKTKYYWRVLSRRGADTSAWSGVWNFTTIVPVPASPVQALPSAGATSQPINPTAVSWNAVADAATYRLQIAADSLFTSPVVQDSALTAPSKQVSGLLYGARYFWRVSAKNVAGISPYSPIRSFTTKLEPPNIITPLNGAVSQPVRLVLRMVACPRSRFLPGSGFDHLGLHDIHAERYNACGFRPSVRTCEQDEVLLARECPLRHRVRHKRVSGNSMELHHHCRYSRRSGSHITPERVRKPAGESDGSCLGGVCGRRHLSTPDLDRLPLRRDCRGRLFDHHRNQAGDGARNKYALLLACQREKSLRELPLFRAVEFLHETPRSGPGGAAHQCRQHPCIRNAALARRAGDH